MRDATLAAVVIAVLACGVFGQAPETHPATAAAGATQPVDVSSTQPVVMDEAYKARVLRVIGKVSYSLMEADGSAGAWQEAQAGDLLPAGTRIRTRLRSKVILAFGEDSVVVVEQLTLASIDQFHRLAEAKVVRLSLGHGAVRAGVSETTLRSEMTIATPTATLSKRGTLDFGIQYEPSSGRYRVYLEYEGLLEVTKNTGESRLVLPGQFVTQKMQRWTDTALEHQWVAVVDPYGLTSAETAFGMLRRTGFSILGPGGGPGGGPSGGPSGSDMFPGGVRPSLAPVILLPVLPIVDRGLVRPEGNFGTGTGR